MDLAKVKVTKEHIDSAIEQLICQQMLSQPRYALQHSGTLSDLIKCQEYLEALLKAAPKATSKKPKQ